MKGSWVILFIVCFGLAGCSNEGNVSPPVKKMGTTDGGGGNGTQNKMYEAYAVDPQTLPAYQKYIAPGFDRIDREMLRDSKASESPIQWKNLIKTKTWYFVPLEISAISKEVLGVSFSKDETQQIAVQTSKEVWIDSRAFDRMSLYDQAILLTHETVMSFYFLKYQSFTEMCTSFAQASKHQFSCEEYRPLDEFYPHKVPQPLNFQDYQNIRNVGSCPRFR
jgi:hypothetical protein